MNPDPTRTVPRSGGTAPPAPPGAPPGPFEGGAPDHIGRFRLLGELGRGGMGVVYRARDNLGREVALKVLLPELAADARSTERFLREARAQARVAHDHVVQIFEAGETDGRAYIVMPLLVGLPLKDALHGARPPVAELVRIGREIADGLAAAHAVGLIHRDVKPGNIWLEGKPRRVKILDFGLARTVADAPEERSASRPKIVSAELTVAGALTGTPAYMSPEQARAHPVDVRSDVFSLGVVLYEMATGRKPFIGANMFEVLAAISSEEPVPLAELAPHVPPALADLISRMLAKDPAARPQSCAEVSAALSALAVPSVVALPLPVDGGAPNVWEDLTVGDGDTEPDRTEAEDAPPEPRAERRPRPKWLWPAVAGAVALLAVCAALALRGKPAERAKNEPEPPAPKPAQKPAQKTAPPVATLTRDQFVEVVDARGGRFACGGKYATTGAEVPDGATGCSLALASGSHRRPQWMSEPNFTQPYIDTGEVKRPFGAGELAALGKFAPDTFEHLYLIAQPLADADLEHVLGYPSVRDLRGLQLTNCSAAAGGSVRAAARLRGLDSLDLDGTAVADADLAPLPGDARGLRRLALRGTKLTNGAVGHLKRIGTLTSLDVRDTALDEAAANELAVALPRCWIAYGKDQRIAPAGAVGSVGDRAAAAHALKLGGYLLVRQGGTNKSVGKGQPLPEGPIELTQVNLTSTGATDADLAAFAGCVHLNQFDIAHNPKFTGEGLVHLKGCKKLTHFVAGSTPIGDAGFAHLRGLPDLAHCALSNCPNVTNKIVETCRELPALTSLDLRDTGISEAGARAISDARPRCRVEWGRGGPGTNVIGPKEK